jgi:hypothetical protein
MRRYLITRHQVRCSELYVKYDYLGLCVQKNSTFKSSSASYHLYIFCSFGLQADLKIGEPKAAVMGGFTGPGMEDTSVNAGNLKQGSSSIGGAYEDVQNDWPIRENFNW